MKTLILAAFAVISLGLSVGNAHDFHNGSTISGDAQATRMQQSGVYSGG